MSGGYDWLLRPVMRGLCKYESLIDGALSMVDIALMHEAMDVESENQDRVRNDK